MIYTDDTIAAISTPSGSGGIGIIRISGFGAFEAADKLFFTSDNKKDAVSSMKTHTIRHGYIKDPETGETVDECLISKMDAPRTYTRENVAEINCHGGAAVEKKILNILYSLGVRPAEPGEFTKRAFLNGRMDLTEAEAVMDIINANTDYERKTAENQLSGALSEKINNICDKLTGFLAETEVSIDYPEYDTDEEVKNFTAEGIEEAVADLTDLLETAEHGRIIREGFRVVIAGKPNAGKSSLLNRISGRERAIVTDIPGTTRDTIEETVDFSGIKVLITDTAGLRETEDIVEKIGVDRTKDALKKADLIILLVDPSEEDAGKDIDEEDFPRDKTLVAVNKTDTVSPEAAACVLKRASEKGYKTVSASMKTEDGEKEITDEISKMTQSVTREEKVIITRERHRILIEKALSYLKNVRQSIKENRPLDMISFDLWQCTKTLGEITGKDAGEDVIEKIFSEFCIGK